MIRVFITALTPALRAGLRAMLTAPEMEVVGEAPTLDGLPVADLADADVVVAAAANLPADIAPLTARPRPLALVVLDVDPQAVAALRALDLRGWGVVSTDAPAAELRAAVVAAAEGLVVLPTAFAADLLDPAVTVAAPPPEPLDEPLTPREQEVLELLGQGMPNKLIARTLGISEHTVKFHVSSIYAKLGAASRTEAVSRGARRGLITL